MQSVQITLYLLDKPGFNTFSSRLRRYIYPHLRGYDPPDTILFVRYYMRASLSPSDRRDYRHGRYFGWEHRPCKYWATVPQGEQYEPPISGAGLIRSHRFPRQQDFLLEITRGWQRVLLAPTCSDEFGYVVGRRRTEEGGRSALLHVNQPKGQRYTSPPMPNQPSPLAVVMKPSRFLALNQLHRLLIKILNARRWDVEQQALATSYCFAPFDTQLCCQRGCRCLEEVKMVSL